MSLQRIAPLACAKRCDVYGRRVVSDRLVEFNKAMHEIYRRALVEARYNATVFQRMLTDRGPLETARYLIHTPRPSDGFTALWERGRLNLTVEALVLSGQFDDLFTDDERAICRQRLEQYGWKS